MLGFMAMLGLVGAVFFKFREVLPIDQMKVTLSMCQIIASASSVYSIPWPSMFTRLLDAFQVFLVDVVSLTR